MSGDGDRRLTLLRGAQARFRPFWAHVRRQKGDRGTDVVVRDRNSRLRETGTEGEEKIGGRVWLGRRAMNE